MNQNSQKRVSKVRRKTIFISAYRDFAIRYLLYSDVFQKLRSQPCRIVIFLRDNDLEFYRDRFVDENIILEPVHYHEALSAIRRSRLSSFFVLVRKCMSGSANGIENTTDQVRRYQYRKEMSRNLTSRIRFWLANGLSLIGMRNRLLRTLIVTVESIIFKGKMYDPYFEKYAPKMLIVTSLGHMIDPYFMRAARRYGCRVVSVMRNFDAPTTKDYRGAHIDEVIVWNEIMRDEVNTFHDVPRDSIHIGGIAHWDFYFNGQFKPRSRNEFLKANNLTQNRKVIFYATSGFRLFTRTFDVIEQLLERIEEGGFCEPVQLLVRLHPAYLAKDGDRNTQVIDNYRNRIEQISQRYKGLVSFVHPQMQFLRDGIDTPIEDMIQLAETFYYSDVLVNEYSTVMIEATIFDLPIINVGLYNYRNTEKPMTYLENFTHIKRLLKSGASKNAYTMDQLIEYINYYLEDRARDREARKRLFDQEITTNIGCAGTATGDILIKLIESGSRKGAKSAKRVF